MSGSTCPEGSWTQAERDELLISFLAFVPIEQLVERTGRDRTDVFNALTLEMQLRGWIDPHTGRLAPSQQHCDWITRSGVERLAPCAPPTVAA